MTRAGRLLELRERYRQELQSARAAGRLLHAVDLLFAKPVPTVREVEAALECNFSSAQRYVSRLEEAGLLREVTGQARNRVYRADEVLRAIEQPWANEGRAG